MDLDAVGEIPSRDGHGVPPLIPLNLAPRFTVFRLCISSKLEFCPLVHLSNLHLDASIVRYLARIAGVG